MWASRTETPWLTGREHAYAAKGEYEDRDFSFNLGYTEVGDNFNPEVGFLLRSGYRSIDGGPLWHIRLPSVDWMREIAPHLTYQVYWDFDGFKESELIHIDAIGAKGDQRAVDKNDTPLFHRRRKLFQ